MIVLDASALVAILAEEPDAKELADRLGRHAADRRFTSTITLWEASCAVARLKALDRPGGFQIVMEFQSLMRIEPVAPDATITALAVEAAERYGMGKRPRYPGILNLGDCFSYATATHLGAALLFKGDDFGRTDILVA